MTKQVITMIGLLVFSATVFAIPPHQPKVADKTAEMWHMTAFADDSSNHVGNLLLKICFYPQPSTGTHDVYLWEIINLPGMTLGGEARQEGDQIVMVGGGYQTPPGPPNITLFTSMQWEIVSNDLGAGHWQYWTLNPLFMFSNAIFTRVPKGICPLHKGPYHNDF